MAERGGPDASASAELSQAAQLHDRRHGRHARRATHRMPDVRPAVAPVASPGSSAPDDEGPDRQLLATRVHYLRVFRAWMAKYLQAEKPAADQPTRP